MRAITYQLQLVNVKATSYIKKTHQYINVTNNLFSILLESAVTVQISRNMLMLK